MQYFYMKTSGKMYVVPVRKITENLACVFQSCLLASTPIPTIDFNYIVLFFQFNYTSRDLHINHKCLSCHSWLKVLMEIIKIFSTFAWLSTVTHTSCSKQSYLLFCYYLHFPWVFSSINFFVVVVIIRESCHHFLYNPVLTHQLSVMLL